MKSIQFTPSLPWQHFDSFPGRLEVKVLRDDTGGGGRTLLVRIPAGGEIPAHSHLGVVQYYLIEGDCEKDGQDYPAVTYGMLPVHADVSPIRSRDGAVLLLIYDPVQQGH